MSPSVRVLCLRFWFLLFASFPALAGTSAELKGKVADKAGNPLPGTTVVIRNDETSLAERGAQSDSEGNFRFPGLPPGPGYRVRATLPGYAPVEFSEIGLSAGQSLTLMIVLGPSSEVRETIRVRGETEAVSPESVTTSSTFSSEFISGIPILGRDYQDMLTLAPGVTDVNQTGNPNIHGARDTSVLTLVDGVNTTDPLTGYYGQQMNIDSIEEIEVITSGANAEYGRAQGGFVNVITKSGGNEFKGGFKFFIRSYRLDGDGAGIDPPELRGGLTSGDASPQLHFTDLYPFLSVSGPFRKDRLWYYLASEYIQVETPINAINQEFVTRTSGHREFAKASWQISSSHRLALSLNLDQARDENQGLGSHVDIESGYQTLRGGPTTTLKGTSVFGPRLMLESSASWFDNGFSRLPTLNPDTNHNGILYIDNRADLGGNNNGFHEARERDPGEDYDRDGRFDIFEDRDHDGFLSGCQVIVGVGIVCEEDLDGDGRLTPLVGCEGAHHEDANCNGTLDSEFDLNQNGVVDPEEDKGIPCSVPGLCPKDVLPGTAGNHKFDTEDKNGNGQLDVVGDSGQTPYPFWKDRNGNGQPDSGEFTTPLKPDRDYIINRPQGSRVSGPNPYQYDDHRKRFSLREDFSWYLDDLAGSHDLKMGGIFEHESFNRTTDLRATLQIYSKPLLFLGIPGTIIGYLPTVSSVGNSASGDNFGFYLQDHYKPLPNLSIGVGVRVDLENLSSFGYTPFDPAAERRTYDDLLNVTGLDTDPWDGVTALGLGSDPLYLNSASGVLPLQSLFSSLKSVAPRHLTQHNFVTDIESRFLTSVLGPGVTLQDLLNAGVNARRPEEIRITNANLAPRLSLAWNPRNDGKSKVFVSWNRYFDKLFLNTVVPEEGPDTVTRYYSYDVDGLDSIGRPDNQVGSPFSFSPPSAFQIDRGLKTPYTDEWTAGVSVELAPEASFSLTYIDRNYRDQLQTVDVNHHTRIDPLTGRLSDYLGIMDKPPRSNFPPGALSTVQRPDGRPDLFINNFLFNRILRLGNFNTQTYRGLEAQFVRRLRRRWQMEASYTYSRSWGDAESYLSENGDDPSTTEFETGYLDYDQRHVVKLGALTNLPRDWKLGFRAAWSSGLPFSFIQSFSDMNDVGFIQNRRTFGTTSVTGVFLPEQRNIHRNHGVYDFNARLEKNFVMGKAVATGFFEVFNILNSDDLRIYYIDPGATNLPGGTANAPQEATSLQAEAERRFGRRYQFGVQFDF